MYVNIRGHRELVANEYEAQVLEFKYKTQTNIIINFVGQAMNLDWSDKYIRNFYDVFIINERTNRHMKIRFWDSVYNTKHHKTPTEYSILACLTKYDPGTFKEFCSEFGFDDDSIKAYKTYAACMEEYKNIERLYTKQELEMLREIN